MLAWIGARARWVMPAGIVVAIAAPELASLLRPALPVLVLLTLGLSMARLDLPATLRAALAPRRAGLLLALVLALMPGWALVAHGAALALGLPPTWAAAALYAALAPPIASAAGLCLMLGLGPRLALEFTLLGTALTPLIGPAVVGGVLGEAVPLAIGPLSLRLGLTVLGAVAVALVLRRIAGPARIARAGRSFDGVIALAMAAFFISLFDGFAAKVAADPARAAGLLALAFVLNTGAAVAVARLGRAAGLAEAGGLGLAAGNRTVALYLAVLPPDPVFQLLVALYQIPMSLIPLMGPLLQRDRAARA